MRKKFNTVCHIVSAYEDRTTGPKNSVTSLSNQLNQLSDVKSMVISDVAKNEFVHNGTIVSPLRGGLPDADVYVFSGVYNKAYVSISKRLCMNGLPYVISPRSSFMVPSMSKSYWKKNAFIKIYGRSFIRQALGVHYLCDDERDNSIRLPLRSFIASNGVPDVMFSEVTGLPRANKRMGFMGRLDIRHKGLDLFVDAIKKQRKNISEKGWKVVLRGPDFQGGRKWLENFVEQHRLQEIVEIGGELSGQDKIDFLQSLSVFIHFSRYEGQPQSVMEAMSCGCAIAVSRYSNMGQLARVNGCGWVSSLSSIDSTISEILSDGDIRDKRENALGYARDNYPWRKAACEFWYGLNSI